MVAHARNGVRTDPTDAVGEAFEGVVEPEESQGESGKSEVDFEEDGSLGYGDEGVEMRETAQVGQDVEPIRTGEFVRQHIAR